MYAAAKSEMLLEYKDYTDSRIKDLTNKIDSLKKSDEKNDKKNQNMVAQEDFQAYKTTQIRNKSKEVDRSKELQCNKSTCEEKSRLNKKKSDLKDGSQKVNKKSCEYKCNKCEFIFQSK